ncbi:hypothetical protein GCM10009731_19280 [Streptomyces globosus]
MPGAAACLYPHAPRRTSRHARTGAHAVPHTRRGTRTQRDPAQPPAARFCAAARYRAVLSRIRRIRAHGTRHDARPDPT